jgi:hypothetical protein
MRGSRSDEGETRVAKNGYHYTKTEEKWRLTHHIVAEEKLGRPLRPTERVVFLDRDRTNLDPDNIGVKRKTTASLRKKEAYLVRHIEELTQELASVRERIKAIEAGELSESSNAKSNPVRLPLDEETEVDE